MKGFFICLFIYFIQSMKAGEEVRKKPDKGRMKTTKTNIVSAF